MSVVKNTKGWLIETPSGFLPFEGVQKVIRDECVSLTFDDGTHLKCSTNHRFLLDSGLVEAINLEVGCTLPSINGYKTLISKELLQETIELYDPLNVADGSLFFSDGVISHNCSFIGSTQTLIHPETLASLVAIPPISHTPITVYKAPEENRRYIVSCDCGEGVGQNYSAIQVIDISTNQYEQVAAWHDNTIKPHELALRIKEVAQYYNDALIFVEDASSGPLVMEGIANADYHNILSIEKQKGKDLPTVKIGRNTRGKFGAKTTQPTKLHGCIEIKRLIESKVLIINDRDTIAELESFSRQGVGYAAEEGNFDDLVMPLVTFGWLHTMKEFKGLIEDSRLSPDELKAKAGVYAILQYMEEMNQPDQFVADGLLWVRS